MTDVYEFSEFDRENLIYRFATMTPAETQTAKSRLSSYEKEQAAKKVEAAAAAAAKMAPSVAPPPAAPKVAPSEAPPQTPPGTDAPGTKG
jgi:peptidoglycan hydrolase CwlO-like protein